ncbi:MAG TPA: F0F1 ATP synthase subunit epsilon, partial [Caldilineaceae bacterium]|nr:F0F1 ATP synthase subunit epsilon [Caldilineaceae bacterium]
CDTVTSKGGGMQLKVLLPTAVLVDEPVVKVIAEAENGSFCLLPRHVDFVAALVPGLLSFTTAEGVEEFLAVDEGILVKQGDDVRVSVINGVRGGALAELRALVTQQFERLDERERRARSALARMEADFVRRFIELREGLNG